MMAVPEHQDGQASGKLATWSGRDSSDTCIEWSVRGEWYCKLMDKLLSMPLTFIVLYTAHHHLSDSRPNWWPKHVYQPKVFTKQQTQIWHQQCQIHSTSAPTTSYAILHCSRICASAQSTPSPPVHTGFIVNMKSNCRRMHGVVDAGHSGWQVSHMVTSQSKRSSAHFFLVIYHATWPSQGYKEQARHLSRNQKVRSKNCLSKVWVSTFCHFCALCLLIFWQRSRSKRSRNRLSGTDLPLKEANSSADPQEEPVVIGSYRRKWVWMLTKGNIMQSWYVCIHPHFFAPAYVWQATVHKYVIKKLDDTRQIKSQEDLAICEVVALVSASLLLSSSFYDVNKKVVHEMPELNVYHNGWLICEMIWQFLSNHVCYAKTYSNELEILKRKHKQGMVHHRSKKRRKVARG